MSQPGVTVHEGGRPETGMPVSGDLHAVAPYPRATVRSPEVGVDADVSGPEGVETPGDLLSRVEEVVSLRLVVRVTSARPCLLRPSGPVGEAGGVLWLVLYSSHVNPLISTGVVGEEGVFG